MDWIVLPAKPFGQRPDDRDPAAHAGFKSQLYALARDAASKISSPCSASKALFAVTTCLPGRDRVQDDAFGRIVSADQFHHDVDRSDRPGPASTSVVRTPGGNATPRSLAISRSAIRTSSIGTPTRRLIKRGIVEQDLGDAGAHRAEPDDADADARLHSSDSVQLEGFSDSSHGLPAFDAHFPPGQTARTHRRLHRTRSPGTRRLSLP